MAKRTQNTPEQVQRSADAAWQKWRGRIAAIPMPERPDRKAAAPGRRYDPLAGQSNEQRMIDKIRQRMREYPEWYETDPDKVASAVSAQLERIGETLMRQLPRTDGPVDVWEVRLSVFNWLVTDESGERFVRGAVSAWPSAQVFNTANNPTLRAADKARARADFLDLAPLLLRGVVEQLLHEDLWITFAQKFTGPDFTALVMRVQRPVA